MRIQRFCDMSGGMSVWAFLARVKLRVIWGLGLGPMDGALDTLASQVPNFWTNSCLSAHPITGLRPTVPRPGHPPEASRLLCKKPEGLAAALQLFNLIYVYVYSVVFHSVCYKSIYL